MYLLQGLVLASYILLHVITEKSEARENGENNEIQALFDYETGLIFYKDDSIPACFAEIFSDSSFSSPVLRLPIHYLENNRTEFERLRFMSSAGLQFCQDLPVINMNVQEFPLPIIRRRQHQLKDNKRRLMWGKVRRKRQSYGYYRSGPTGEARAQGHWNAPGKASQAQVQGQVFGTGIFSGQAQTQSGGMSQSQVQLSGVGIRGQIASSSGNAQAQLSLGNGAGSGQASGLGEGPSNSQVQVTLGQGNEESMASASATSGGATAGIGSGGGGSLFTNGGGYHGLNGGGFGSGGSDGGGYRNGNAYVPGYRNYHETPSPGGVGVSRGQYSNGGGSGPGHFPQNGNSYTQQTMPSADFGGQRGAPSQLHGYPGADTQSLRGSETGRETSYGGTNGQRATHQGFPGSQFGSSPGIQKTNNGVGNGVGFSHTNGAQPYYGSGAGGNPGVAQSVGPQTGVGSGSSLDSRDQSRHFDFDRHPGLHSNGYREHSSLPPNRGLPTGVGVTSENGYRRVPASHGGLPTEGYPAGVRPYAQSSTPGAYASSHGIGQAQAQTVYFGSAGNGRNIPRSYFQDSQPARGRTNIDGVQRFQDQQVGVGTVGQRQQTGGNVPSPASTQNGYRVSTTGRNGFSSTYSNGGNNGQQYTNGGRSTSHGTGSTTVPQTPQGPSPDGGRAHISGSESGSPSIVGGSIGDSQLQGTRTPVSTGEVISGHSQQLMPSPSTSYSQPTLWPSTSYVPVNTITSQQNGQQQRLNGGSQSAYHRQPIPQQTSTASGSSHHLPGAIRNGQPYRINGLGQVIPAGHSRHPISPTTTTITGGGGPDAHTSHTATSTHEQSGLFPSYGVTRVSPDDPDGNKCTIITFSCTIVIESNGRAKICKPNAVRVNSNGGNGHNNGGAQGTTGSKICCC